MKTEKIPRKINNLVEHLILHLGLLEDFNKKAFAEGNQDYLGEISGKLRLLVYKGKSNTPLLLELMKYFNFNRLLNFEKPWGKETSTLKEYLESTAFGINVPNRGFVEISVIDYIRLIAEQYGSAHEDWKINDELAYLLESGIFIQGLSSASAILKSISETILLVGKEFLQYIENQK